LIKKLLYLLDNSKKIYDLYILNGQIFLYAKKLRKINKKILDLIEKPNFVKDQKIKKPLLSLKKHIKEWIILWDKEQVARKPNNKDVFIFAGYTRFPKGLESFLISTLK